MKALICISTCEAFRVNGNNDAVRQTWAKDVAALNTPEDCIDYMFFTGRDTVFVKPDEVKLDVPDDYQNVTRKTIESRRWALAYGYQWVFQTYPDVYIRPERLLAALKEYRKECRAEQTYVGYPTISHDKVPYASGGAGYWLGPKENAMLLSTDEAYDWAEDRWVGHVMARNGVTLWADTRYSPFSRYIFKRNEQITSHMSRSHGDGQPGFYDKQWMYNTHRIWEISQ